MPDEDKAVGTTPVYIARWGGGEMVLSGMKY